MTRRDAGSVHANMSNTKSTAAQPENQVHGRKNETLEREAKDGRTVVLFSFTFIMLDIWKQVFSYAMKYYNNQVYPVPQTGVVAFTESLKCLVFFGAVIRNGSYQKMTVSAWYAVPSLIYAFNNNVYYFALHYATPPMWNVIIQLRIIFTAFTYKFIFKRATTNIQWVALTLLMAAIVMSNMSGSQLLAGENNLTIAMALAVVGSITSVIGSVTMEYLFKNDTRTFSEMQFQLYAFGSLMSWVLFGFEAFSMKGDSVLQFDPNVDAMTIWLLTLFAITMSMTSGIATAVIVKRLDNIVKLYTQALANMLTSAACTVFFPDHFHLNAFFLGCLLLMCFSVFLYENKNFDVKQTVNELMNNEKIKMPLLLGFILIVMLLGGAGIAAHTSVSNKLPNV